MFALQAHAIDTMWMICLYDKWSLNVLVNKVIETEWGKTISRSTRSRRYPLKRKAWSAKRGHQSIFMYILHIDQSTKPFSKSSISKQTETQLSFWMRLQVNKPALSWRWNLHSSSLVLQNFKVDPNLLTFFQYWGAFLGNNGGEKRVERVAWGGILSPNQMNRKNHRKTWFHDKSYSIFCASNDL